MRRTLRRSCAACAKAKHSCDLQTPKCSRCNDRKTTCTYANEPLTANRNLSKRNTTSLTGTPRRTRNLTHSTFISSSASGSVAVGKTKSQRSEFAGFSLITTGVEVGTFDPFDTYPQTSLPRARVQGLIYHFLSKIIYQYYPWDTDPATNPFMTSWWDLALSDPALFNVSLQTASLDNELQAQKGFIQSEILMHDSISLVRQKIQDPERAYHDATLNAVVILAAIEHGKGNLDISKMHIEGVKQIVHHRGGISQIKISNALTARMVAWVSILVTGSPQFDMGDDRDFLDRYTTTPPFETPALSNGGYLQLNLKTLGVDSEFDIIINKLRSIFGRNCAATILPVADRQDIASFILHKLLPSNERSGLVELSKISEAVRYATCIYMFIIHGPTYYSHMAVLNDLVLKLQGYLTPLLFTPDADQHLLTWMASMGLIASFGTEEHEWFLARCSFLARSSGLSNWLAVETQLRSVLWLDDSNCKRQFCQTWHPILQSENPAGTSGKTMLTQHINV